MTPEERLSELAALPWDWDLDMDGKSPAPVPDAASVEAARDVVRILTEHGFTVTAEDILADVQGGIAVTIDDGAHREAWFSALNGVRTIVTLSDNEGPLRVEGDYLSDATIAQTVAFLRGGPMPAWRRWIRPRQRPYHPHGRQDDNAARHAVRGFQGQVGSRGSRPGMVRGIERWMAPVR